MRTRDLLVLAALLSGAPALAQDCEPQRLVEVLAPQSFSGTGGQVTFSAPGAAQGEWTLTVTRQRSSDVGTVLLNGQTLLSSRDFVAGKTRFDVPVSLQASNVLEVRFRPRKRKRGRRGWTRPRWPTHRSLTVAVEGIVSEAALPAPPAGDRIASATLFDQQFQRTRRGWHGGAFHRGHCRQRRHGDCVEIATPSTDGRFWLVIEPQQALVFVHWNGAFLAVAHRPVRVAVDVEASNTLCVRVLGSRRASARVALEAVVVDNDAPSLSWLSPADGSQAQASTPFELSFEDAVSGVDPGSLQILLNGTDVTPAFTVGDDSARATLADLPVELIAAQNVISATVRDRACNVATAELSFVGPDIEPPTLVQPADLVVEQTSPAGAVVSYVLPPATDDVDPNPTVTCVPAPGSVFGPGVTAVTCTATDLAGNSTSVTFTVTVQDTLPPTATLTPADGSVQERSAVNLSVANSDSGSGVDPGSLVALLDGQSVTGAFTPIAGGAQALVSGLGDGQHVLDVTVSDLAGNPVSVSTTFSVSTRAVALEVRIVAQEEPGAAPKPSGPSGVLPALPTETRSIDGTGNNLSEPGVGAAGVALRRLLPSDYSDGVSAPAGILRPSPREVSNAVHAQSGPVLSRRRLSDLFWAWGQFLDHDLDLTEGAEPHEFLPIPVPLGDPQFDPFGTGVVEIPFNRSTYVVGSSPREQINQITAWIDGSVVYGSDAVRAAALRTLDGTGRLLTTPSPDGDLLPFNTVMLPNAPAASPDLFLAGDVRANENALLTSLHTVFVREHNRLAAQIQAENPGLSGDEVYEAARRIVGAQLQVITYREFLPLLLGPNALTPYAGYQPAGDTGIFNCFSTAAYRLGHSLLSDRLLRLEADGSESPSGHVVLRDAFFNPDRITQEGGIEPFLRGAASQQSQELDALVTDEVRNFLFGPPGSGGLDLASLNVQRGRDHGLPSYNEARRQLGLAARTSFAEITSQEFLQGRLASVYTSVEDVDLWTGALSEDHVEGAVVGELLFTILKQQFEELRDGDRFFYLNQFSAAEVQELEATCLSHIIRRNTGIGAELAESVLTVAPAEAPAEATRVTVLAENDLVLRALLPSGNTATEFTGIVLLKTSDGLPPIDGTLVEFTAADSGEVVLEGLGVFASLGNVLVTAVSLDLPPADISGNALANVVLEQPLVSPGLDPVVAAGEGLVVQGYSFPGGLLELVVDGVVVESLQLGNGGTYAFNVELTPGVHEIVLRATNPETGQVVATPPTVVTVLPPAPVELLAEGPGRFLDIGEPFQLSVTEVFADGSRVDVTGSASYQSSNPAVVTVDEGGLLTGVATGSAMVVVSLDGLEAEVVVEVTEPALLLSSPEDGETGVAVTRETILVFTTPLDPTSLNLAAIRPMLGTSVLPARLHVSPNQQVVTLFYDPPLPASARVRIFVEGDLLRSASGQVVDGDRDGIAGGQGLIEFETLSTSVVAGTSVCGRVFASELSSDGQSSVNTPLAGVTITVDGAEDTLRTTTDFMGNFRLEPAPAGRFFVHIDGRTATVSVPAGAYYPFVGKSWEAEAGVETVVGEVFLPLVREGALQEVSETEETVVGLAQVVQDERPELAGIELRVPADSLYSDDGTRGGMVGIGLVPPDRLPGALPPGLDPPFVITVQTDGATNFDEPVAVRFPNVEGHPPGTKLALWSFNHDTGVFEVVGSMTVSEDGLWIDTDPGSGILAPGWHLPESGVRNRVDVREIKCVPLIPEATSKQECPQNDRIGDCVTVAARNVILNTGEENFTRTDLSIPGVGEVHFTLTRRYRSALEYDGPLGQGWTHNYLEVLDLSDPLAIRRVNGSSHLDKWSRKDEDVDRSDPRYVRYPAPEGFFGALVLDIARRVYIYRTPNGFKHFYDTVDGRLLAHQDRFGNTMEFRYDVDGQLVLVIDPFGRRIEFVNEVLASKTMTRGGEEVEVCISRLTKVIDFYGREINYQYIGTMKEHLIAVTAADGVRTEGYEYDVQSLDGRLRHNLVAITLPEQYPDGPPAIQIEYGVEEGRTSFDRVVRRTVGDPQAGVGGTHEFTYSLLDPNAPLNQVALEVTHRDRSGNVNIHGINGLGQTIQSTVITRGLHPDEPAAYVTRSLYTLNGQLLFREFPEGNSVSIFYGNDDPTLGFVAQRAHQNNVVRIRRVAGPRGGPELVTFFAYEHVYNRHRSVVDPKGYLTRFVFDYQEGGGTFSESEIFGLPVNVDTGLGDVNLDGRVDQAAGNIVQTIFPQVSPNAVRATAQDVVKFMAWNDEGQLTRSVDAEGNITLYEYYEGDNPTGSMNVPIFGERVFPRSLSGHLLARTVDADAPRGPTPRSADGVAAPAQIRTEYSYDPLGNMVSMLDPRGVRTDYEFNELNEVTRVVRGADVTEARSRNQLLTGESAFGYEVNREYDDNGRVTLIRVENVGSLLHPGLGYYETRNEYDLLNNVTTTMVQTGPGQFLTRAYEYDANENLTLVTMPEGNLVQTLYDERNLPFQTTRGVGTSDSSTIRIDYDGNKNRKRVTDAEDNDGDGNGEQTLYEYDGHDRLIHVVDPLGNRSTQVYDENNNVTQTRVDGHMPGAPGSPSVLLSRSVVSYDELNRPFERADELFLSQGYVLKRGASDLGLATNRVVVSHARHDRLGRVDRVIADATVNPQASFTVYDGASRPIVRLDAAGNTVTREYDQSSNVVRSTSLERGVNVPDETYSSYLVYDQLNRVVRATDNAGQTTRFVYDSRDNLVQSFDAEGPPLADPLGLVPGQINGPGNSTAQFFDGLGRVVREVTDLRTGGTGAGNLETSAFNPDGQISVSYQYDGNNRLVRIEDDRGNATLFAYDALDRLVERRNADTTRYLYEYDRDDNVVVTTDPNGSTVTREFDALHRVTSVSVSRGVGVVGTTAETYQYDGLSRTTLISDDNGGTPQVCGFVYDSLSRLVEQTQGPEAVSFLYAGDGRLLSCFYPGGRRLNQAHDILDRVVNISDATPGQPLRGVSEFAYIGPGLRMQQCLNANGTLEDLSGPDAYDGVKRLTQQRWYQPGQPVPFVDRNYAYNRANVRVREERVDDIGLFDEYRYDSAYRLVRSDLDLGGGPGAERREDRSTIYDLDGTGNRRQVTTGSGSVPIAVNEMNEYTSVGGVGRTHDANGNLIDDGERLYEYDYKNRLVNVSSRVSGRLIASYLYDPDNRRTQKRIYDASGDLSSATSYHYDGFRVCEERDAVGAVVQTYVYSPSDVDLVCQIQRTSAHPMGAMDLYLHQNARLDVVAVSNASGQVVEQVVYDEYGKAHRQGDKAPYTESARGNPFGFQGRRLDPETGLYYFRNRMYDPDTGRFLQRDPVWDPNNVGNAYTFGGNSPVSVRDPFGNIPPLIVAGLYGAVIGAISVGGAAAVAEGVTTNWGEYGDYDFAYVGKMTAVGGLAGFAGGVTGGLALKAGLGAVTTGLLTGAVEGAVEGAAMWGFGLSEGTLAENVVVGGGVGALTGGLLTGAGSAFRRVRKSVGGHSAHSRSKTAATESPVDRMPVSCGNCFLAGTLVETAEGKRPVEEIEVGDRVLSRDDRTGEVGYKPVVRLFRNTTETVVSVTVAPQRRGRTESHRVGEEGGASAESDEPPSATQTIECTLGHPWFVRGIGWVYAGDLRVGDKLVGGEGEVLEVVGLSVEKRVEKTFNFEVADWHTYFVAEAAGKPSVWVHNTSCPKFNEYGEQIPNERGDFVNLHPEDYKGPIGRGELIRMEDGRYKVRHPISHEYRTAKGTMEFIMDREGRIWVPFKIAGAPHTDLARAADVRYAGQIRFGKNRSSRGRLKAWNNASGHYRPAAEHSQRVPLPQELFQGKFRDASGN